MNRAVARPRQTLGPVIVVFSPRDLRLENDPARLSIYVRWFVVDMKDAAYEVALALVVNPAERRLLEQRRARNSSQ